MRKNYAPPICCICRTYNRKAGIGIQVENGVHICMECASDISEIVKNFSEEYDIYTNKLCITESRKERHETHDDGD